MSKPNARARKAASPASGDKAIAKPRKVLVSVEDRIPAMTDGDLKTLHANAARLAVSGEDSQRTDAQRLLPVITAEVEARAIARSKAFQDQRAALRQSKAKTSRARRRKGAASEPGTPQGAVEE